MTLPLLAFLLLAPQTVELTPTDDVWVYPHASDGAHDANLRVWGYEGKAAPADATEAEELSMAYLKWDVASVPAGKKLTKARLVLTNIANPGYTLEQAKAAPLQARPLAPDFTEKSWEFESLGKLLPKREKLDVFGVGAPEKLVADKPAPIEIDLMKGPNDFGKYLAAALGSPSKQMALALTSTIDMATLGRTGIYKFYSRDERDATVRPRLVLTFE
ncbi:hypothetical protein [Fimbriimonas ginsengisoli]|uniref:Uncharacterized protein n=1 Tax=Fimbriimonas ginsengisoli Gsoil 348 TaxID=661478 RepID=A0A068NSD2_FIMGI|nr:hypothetical protein [Fimbriimonas ginsengisoli]AIE86453.1 hypothetical protein OP10G_3085 [Fimbriimonas ginsengisoli Gsoil 348]